MLWPLLGSIVFEDLSPEWLCCDNKKVYIKTVTDKDKNGHYKFTLPKED